MNSMLMPSASRMARSSSRTCAWADTIQRRDRLVADQQAGLQGDRPGDGDALALAAGESAGQPAGIVPRQPDPREEVADLAGQVADVSPSRQHLAQRRADPQGRIERGVRILETTWTRRRTCWRWARVRRR